MFFKVGFNSKQFYKELIAPNMSLIFASWLYCSLIDVFIFSPNAGKYGPEKLQTRTLFKW